MKFVDIGLLMALLQITHGKPSAETQLNYDKVLLNNNYLPTEPMPSANTPGQIKFHIQYAPLPLKNSIQYTTEIFAVNIDFTDHNKTMADTVTLQTTKSEVFDVAEQANDKIVDNLEVIPSKNSMTEETPSPPRLEADAQRLRNLGLLQLIMLRGNPYNENKPYNHGQKNIGTLTKEVQHKRPYIGNLQNYRKSTYTYEYGRTTPKYYFMK